MIKKWNDYYYFRTKTKHPTLEMDAWLCNLINNSNNDKDIDKAKEELLKNYYNLAYSIASKCNNRGVDFDDLLQSAQLGLLYAATKYDPSKSKFSTYATPWIWQYCLRLIENTGRTIRLPNHIHELLIGIIREGIDLSYTTLEHRLQIPADKIDMAINGYRTQTLPIDDFIDYDYEDMEMDEILDKYSYEQAMSIFDGDALTAKMFADYIGDNDNDTPLSIDELAENYNVSVAIAGDIINRAIELLKAHYDIK